MTVATKTLAVCLSLIVSVVAGSDDKEEEGFWIPPFPEMRECVDYLPHAHEWFGDAPVLMECPDKSGGRFSIYDKSWFDRYLRSQNVAVEDVNKSFKPVYIMKLAHLNVVGYASEGKWIEFSVVFEQNQTPLFIFHGTPWFLGLYTQRCKDEDDQWVSSHSPACKKNEQMPEDFPYHAFSSYSRGAHCCYTVLLIDKEEPNKLSHVFHSWDSYPWFADLDGDGSYEIITLDWSYNYFPNTYVQSPSPKIIWRITPMGFSLAPDLMSQPFPDQSILTLTSNRIRENFINKKHLTEGFDPENVDPSPERYQWVHEDLYGTTLDLIYSGHETEAWEFYDQAWLTDIPGKKSFKEEFIERICKSPFAKGLADVNRQEMVMETCG